MRQPDQNNVVMGKIIEAIQTCYDPAIPVNIYDPGLIYDIKLDDKSNVDIDMTLTSPACPVAVTLPKQVESRVKQLDTVTGVTVNVVWEPPWSPERMSDEARLELGMI